MGDEDTNASTMADTTIERIGPAPPHDTRRSPGIEPTARHSLAFQLDGTRAQSQSTARRFALMPCGGDVSQLAHLWTTIRGRGGGRWFDHSASPLLETLLAKLMTDPR